jgi:UDP-sugar diphosphatase
MKSSVKSSDFVITEFQEKSLDTFDFIKPLKLTYKVNGKLKTWEAVKSFDSVAVLLYHKKKDSFLLVKQFRAPVYLNDKNANFTYELCAGIIDKEMPLKEIVKEEIYEECGYDVGTKDIQKITSFYTNVGVSGAKQHLYYVTIDESQKVGSGGGIDDELILPVFVPLKEAKKFMFDESKAKTPGLLFAFSWFLQKNR